MYSPSLHNSVKEPNEKKKSNVSSEVSLYNGLPNCKFI